jgi:hypothetical protein
MVMSVARRLAGLIVALVLAASLPLAAARAACACDHGHDGAAAETPHTCTSACTEFTCPMHARAAAGAKAARHDAPARDGISCNCAGEARALIAQVTPAAVLPPAIGLAAPDFVALPRPSLDETPLSLAASPPAPPPRA